MIRVLLTGPELAGFSGGIQSFVRLLTDGFAGHADVRVSLFATTLGLYDRESWTAKVRRGACLLAPFWRRLAGCDVVHINSTFDNRSVIRDFLLVGLARARGKPVVIEFHGGDPRNVRLFTVRWLRPFAARMLARCRLILVLSARQAEQLRALVDTGQRMRQVANYLPDQGGTVARSPHAGTGLRFLFLGRLHAEKGVREIVAAARALMLQGESFQVTFCGDGPERAWLEDQLQDAALARCVTYRGVVAGGEKLAALDASDVLLLPTRHNEGFPLVLLEAMSRGLAIVASPSGAIAEVLERDPVGDLVPSGDVNALVECMRRCLRDPARVGVQGQSGRQAVQRRYSIEAMRATFLDVYQAACGVR
jgi:glycosyltransferase involved in cell wall biosynthesis